MQNYSDQPLYPVLLESGIRLDFLRTEDAEVYFDFINRHRSYLERYDVFFKDLRTIDDVQAVLKQIQALRDQGRSLTCALWDDSRFIGTMNGGLKDDSGMRLGFAIAPGYQGRGIVTQAAEVLLQYAFEVLKIRYAWLTCWVTNERCRRVAERLGFVPDLDLIPVDLSHGVPVEQVRYTLVNPQIRD